MPRIIFDEARWERPAERARPFGYAKSTASIEEYRTISYAGHPQQDAADLSAARDPPGQPRLGQWPHPSGHNEVGSAENFSTKQQVYQATQKKDQCHRFAN